MYILLSIYLHLPSFSFKYLFLPIYKICLVDPSAPRDHNKDDEAMRTISLERMDRLNFEMHPPTDR